MESASIATYRRADPNAPDSTGLTDPGDAGQTSATRAQASDDWIAIIEPNFTGHRWRYVEWIAQACVEAGHRCLVITDAGYAQHPLAQRIVREARPDLRLVLLDLHTVPRGVLYAASVYMRFRDFYARALVEVQRTMPVRLVVAPYADYFFYTLAPLGSPFGETPWIAIVMGMTFHHAGAGLRTPRRPVVDLAKSLLFRRGMRVRGLRTLFTIDPTLPDWYAATKPAQGARLAYVADPFPETPAADRQEARARLGLDTNTRYLLVYGAIGERKGIRELMRALIQLGAGHDAPRLVIAGQQDDETRAFINAHAPRITPAPVIFDQFVSDAMERDLFSACDAVWLGYLKHYGMSGVLVQAYRFNVPVLASADGLIGWFCRDGSLGPQLDDLEPATIARALAALPAYWRDHENVDSRLAAGTPAAGMPDAGTPDANHLLARNTLDEFKRTLQSAMA
ncbi:glycosyltransferase [Paraburkholderia acidisoli]|uniref:Glycosyltransferase n=1 Tax=Paraburkholderia acidisoli TaxID=2571748 RepID=A0A7Z2JD12_9BURK|nr:glycosyltransferase [Paraburkholderia acidisoli]QGZ60667.1 glycosyltransferase [Paraburkholderia acidisoli]